MANTDVANFVAEHLRGSSFALKSDDVASAMMRTLVEGLSGDGCLRIANATLRDGHAEQATVVGNGDVFGVTGVAVSATFGEGSACQVQLDDLSSRAPWQLSLSVPGLKNTFVDGLPLGDVRLRFNADPRTDLPGDLETQFGRPALDPPLPTPELGGIDLTATVDLGTLGLGMLGLGGCLLPVSPLPVQGMLQRGKGGWGRLWLRSASLPAVRLGSFSLAPSIDVVALLRRGGDGQLQPETFVRLSAQVTLGKHASCSCIAEVSTPGPAEIVFTAHIDAASPPAFADLAKAVAGGKVLGDAVALLSRDLQSFCVKGLQLHLKTAAGAIPGSLQTLTADVDCDQPLVVVADVLSLTDLHAAIVVPLADRDAQPSATVSFAATLAHLPLQGSLRLPEGSFAATPAQGASVDLGAAFAALLLGPAPLDLKATALQVSGSLQKRSLSLDATLASDWTLALGVAALHLEQVRLQLEVQAQGDHPQASGSIKGELAVGDAHVCLTYAMPGDVVLRGESDSLGLLEIIEHLVGKQVLAGMPVARDLFAVALTDVQLVASVSEGSVVVTGSGAGFAQVELFVAKEKATDGPWGFALGLCLHESFHLSQLSPLLQPLDGLHFDDPFVVVSSFSTQVCPLSQAPVGLTGQIEQGINLCLPIDLAKNPSFAPVAKMVGKTGTSLQLRGTVSSQTCELAASVQGFAICSGVEFASAGLQLAVTDDGDFTASIFGDLLVKLHDPLTFDARMSIEPNGADLSATMTGTWNKPFGLPGVTLANVAVEVGVSDEGVPTVGVAGTAHIAHFDGSFALLFNGIAPAESVVAVTFNELSLAAIIADAISGDARKAMPNALVSLLDSGLQDVNIYLAPVATQLGTISYSQGMRLKATTVLFGWRARISASFSYTSGLVIDGSAEPLRLGHIGNQDYVFALTAGSAANGKGSGQQKLAHAPDDLGGPRLAVNLTTAKPPAFSLSFHAQLLGFIAQDVVADANSDGVAITLQRTLGPTSLEVQAQVGARGFAGKAVLGDSLSINAKLTVPGTHASLGTVNFSTSLRAQIALRLTPKVFRAEVVATFAWQNQKITTGTIALAVAPRSIGDFVAHIGRAIERDAYALLRSALHDIAAFGEAIDKGAIKVGKAIGQEAEATGVAIQRAFHATADDAAVVFRKAGHSVEEAAGALRSVFHADASTAARALKAAGHDVEAIGEGLKTAFRVDANAAAKALKEAGFNAEATARSLQHSFTSAGKAAGLALRAAGFSPADVANNLQHVFGMSLADTGKFLQTDLGQDAKAVQSILKASGAPAEDVENAMKNLGDVGKNVGNELKKVFHF